MRFSTSVALAASSLVAIVSCRAVETRHVLHEKRSTLPYGWSRHSEVPADYIMPVAIGLKQNNLENAESFLYSLSDPASEEFGRHWSAKEVEEHFAPSKETVERVKEWLHSAGIDPNAIKQSKSKGWIQFHAKAGELEELLQTKYYIYEHVSGQSHVACESYSVDHDASPHVDFISPTVHFDVKLGADLDSRRQRELRGLKKRNEIAKRYVPGSHPKLGVPGSGTLPKIGATLSTASFNNGARAGLKTCDEFITPNCLRALYGFGQVRKANKKNSYGIVEYTPQAYLQSDLDIFFGNFSPPLVGQSPILDSVDGGVVQTIEKSFDFNGESDLDLEYAMTLSYPVPITLYQVGDIPEADMTSFNNFLDAIDGSYCTFEGGDDKTFDASYPDNQPGGYKGPENCGTYAPTNVISTSYGYNAADLTPAYEIRQCQEYLKLGLQGVTVLYSSGDNGVAGNGNTCIDPATGEYNDGSSGTFNVGFPGTCPFVTSVGATQINPGATVHMPEAVAYQILGSAAAPDNYSSGGGFSNVFRAPDYQKAALANYFANHDPGYSATQYNKTGSRGIPDVSANGNKYIVALEGNYTLIYGTSASSPTFGSIITILNNARLDAGKTPVGFLNPVLYAHPEVMNDITLGHNVGCGTDGFAAVPGWDPATGLGTPNFPKLKALYMSLP